jgi:hypothetical protein
MFMVATELIAASRGLGYLLTDGRETGRADIMLAAIVLLALLGKLSDSAMGAVECRHWRGVPGAAPVSVVDGGAEHRVRCHCRSSRPGARRGAAR